MIIIDLKTNLIEFQNIPNLESSQMGIRSAEVAVGFYENKLANEFERGKKACLQTIFTAIEKLANQK